MRLVDADRKPNKIYKVYAAPYASYYEGYIVNEFCIKEDAEKLALDLNNNLLRQYNYEVIEEGKGEIPADTIRVKVNYEGRLINDTIFDSSLQRNEPMTFRCNQVIPGWTEALTHMPVGSKWKVYIPQDQAYGSREAGGKIKPFSTLVFEIELLSIEK